MRNKIFLVTMIIVLLGLLTACTDSGNSGTDKGNPSPSAAISGTEAPAQNTPSPLPSPTPVPTATPTPSPTPTPVPSIEDLMEATEEEGVYSFTTLNLKGYYMQVYPLKDKLIYFYNKNCESVPKIISYDIANDKTTEKDLEEIDPDKYRFYVIRDKYIVIYDGYTELCFLDENLNELRSFEIPIDSVKPEFIANADYSKIYYFKNRYLFEADTETGEEIALSKNSTFRDAYPTKVSEDGEYLTLYAYNKLIGYYGAYLYKFETDKLIDIDSETHNYVYDISTDGNEILVYDTFLNNTELYQLNEENQLLDYVVRNKDLSKDSLKSTIKLGSYYETLMGEVDWERRFFITGQSYSKEDHHIYEFICYNIDDGSIHSNYIFTLETPDYPSIECRIDYEDGYLIVSGTELDKPFCYIWDYVNDNYEDQSSKFVRMGTIPKYLDEKRREIEEKYNVYVYLGTEIFATQTDYTLTYCDDPSEMYKALCILDEVFSMYPENMLDQIKFNGIKTIGIYLCNGFAKQASYGIDNAVALAGTDQYERFIALDIAYYGDQRRNIIHELSHCIDNRIVQEGNATGEFDFEEEWNALNPKGFYYMNDYNVSSPFGRYTYFQAEEYAYFIDTYSLSKATEDRARLFEYLMRYDSDYNCSYFESAAMREKLHLYFDYIRKVFDTTGWPEETIWEYKLKLLDRMYSGDESVTYEDIYPEYYKGDTEYTISENEYEYLDAYSGKFGAVG